MKMANFQKKSHFSRFFRNICRKNDVFQKAKKTDPSFAQWSTHAKLQGCRPKRVVWSFRTNTYINKYIHTRVKREEPQPFSWSVREVKWLGGSIKALNQVLVDTNIFLPFRASPPPFWGFPRGGRGPKMANFGRKKSYFSVFKNYFSKKLLFPKNEKNRKKQVVRASALKRANFGLKWKISKKISFFKFFSIFFSKK